MSRAFFSNLPFVGPEKPFNLCIGAEQLVHHQTEHVGDTDLTSQELKSGICATQKLAHGSQPKEAQLEFLLLESTNQAVLNWFKLVFPLVAMAVGKYHAF